MDDVLNISIKNDTSVQRLIAKNAKSLERKYTKKRKVNENLLKERTPARMAFAIIFDVLCVLLLLASSIVCFSSINSKIQKVCPTFCGFANLQIASESMVASGFNKFDTVIVRSVDTHTLNVDDIIAFYVYQPDWTSFNINSVIKINETYETKYTFEPKTILGFQNPDIQKAGAAGSLFKFHHIREIYEDENGVRWFKTYGSSNPTDDTEIISERMIVGIYDDSQTARVVKTVISVVSSKYGIFVLIIPIVLIALIIVLECIKDIQLAFLELDCIEEKRKITDPICVRNNIGYNMDLSSKYKILAQATPENLNEYISLLWKGGSVPASVRKYYIRKNLLLAYDQKMLLLNRECEKRFKNGESAISISKYYTMEKKRLEEEQRAKAKELKGLSYKATNVIIDEDKKEESNTTPESILEPEKKKRGRPRKVLSEEELNKPKRKRGRPRKVVSAEEVNKPKRKPGRPRKVLENKPSNSEVKEHKKPGRPKGSKNKTIKIKAN